MIFVCQKAHDFHLSESAWFLFLSKYGFCVLACARLLILSYCMIAITQQVHGCCFSLIIVAVSIRQCKKIANSQLVHDFCFSGSP